MMSSRLELQKPKKLNEGNIRSWFSLKNSELLSPGASIPGLNLGLNTKEKQEVVRTHRAMLLNEINTRSEELALARQVHSSEIIKVHTGGVYPNVDGFVSTTPGVALGIQVADCAAVLLGDPEAGVIAAVHAGWRGAVGDIVPKAIVMMKEEGATAEQIRAFISPCLSIVNFEVGDEVAAQFPESFVDRVKYSKAHVDLKGFIMHQMLKEGILEDHIECDPSCTIEVEDEYYSYRREGDQSGRMMGIIKQIRRE